MYFKGDIIITDPYYIMRDEVSYRNHPMYPKESDFFNGETISHLLNGRYTEIKDDPKLFDEGINRYRKAIQKWEEENPELCNDDWDNCDCGKNMEVLGINTYLTRNTEYGDWSYSTYNSDTKEKIGNFCTEAGLVSVFLLEEVLKYNPKFNYHIERLHTTTLIKDFDGEISIERVKIQHEDEENGEIGEYCEVSVIGKGNTNFHTKQTGF